MLKHKQSQMDVNKDDICIMNRNNWIYIRWFLLRFILVVYDIAVINASVYLAMLTRFYVAKELHSAGIHYFSVYPTYAPYYTAYCVIVFMTLKLYSGIWKYAGFNDLNRILCANLITFIGHVVGTLVCGIRMPISVYCISAVVQVTLIAASRFTYRLLLVEKEKIFNNASVNALLIGAGGTARSVIKQFERESVVRPVCVLNYKETQGINAFFDGLPVVYGTDNLCESIEKYHVNLVVLASTVIPQQTINQIKAICAELNVEVQDYSGFFQMSGGLTLKNLAECSKGTVEIVVNGRSRTFDDGEQALVNTEGRYVVKSIYARDGVLVAELAENEVVLNDLNEDWIKQQKDETGEEVSFF